MITHSAIYHQTFKQMLDYAIAHPTYGSSALRVSATLLSAQKQPIENRNRDREKYICTHFSKKNQLVEKHKFID